MRKIEAEQIEFCNCAGCDRPLLGRNPTNIRRAEDLKIRTPVVFLTHGNKFHRRPYCKTCVAKRNWKEIRRAG